MMAERAHASQG